ncbi:uncharacterized protein LOC129601167 [Paramacrobiotus metropolitanus]|uniref:uncharacterized protein LOC129601167 n=1 Tax=Paramacrobiotus metropolitanus TaxID=2943436 RepID=UPI0024458F3E|nr:uncharacterized protein LOC129601167 [Paramacrobiotus metropolitanus]
MAMAYAGFPMQSSPTLNFSCKIPTEQFALEDLGSSSLRYSCDINVEAGANYPQIPSSTWTVKITIGAIDGSIVANVAPKGPSNQTKSSGTLLVECRVSPSWEGSCDNVVRIDETGWNLGPEKLIQLNQLVQKICLPCGKSHCSLKKNAFVYVELTFHIDLDSLEAAVNRADLKYLFDSHMLSDCTLACQGQEFPVHRAILAGQSPVFAAMFQNDMLEKSTGICKITDISADALKAMIEYVYKREEVYMPTDNGLMELWTAADKYDMADLRAECLREMLRMMKADTALTYFDFARQHKLKKLRAAAARLISLDVNENE